MHIKVEDLTLQVPDNPAPVYQGCDRNPNALTRYLYNKYIFYLKYGNSKTRKYVLALHKIHVIPFPKNDLEELKSRWVRKVIKKIKHDTLFIIGKVCWLRFLTIRGKLVKRSDPYEVFSDQKIVELIRIPYDQGYGKEFMKEIIVKRVDGHMCSFSESDYKYLNKNDIKDLYLMCLKGKINYRENGILKSLNVFIRSSVILERVYDYQL
ncbi:hypothetical protein Tco_0103583 [Tanacetum coccineum]